MKDKEPKLSPEQRFTSLSEEIVKQLKKTCSPEYKAHVTNIIRRETDGGTRALVLDSDGNWSGRTQMMGWPIGSNPNIDSLISEFASINDENYHSIELNEGWEASRTKREEYIQKNKDRLFNGLLTEMESVLQRLQTQN